MSKKYGKIRPDGDDEQAVFKRAFSKSKGKTVSERTTDAQKAVYEYRNGLNKAVDDSLTTKVANRKKKMDEESGF